MPGSLYHHSAVLLRSSWIGLGLGLAFTTSFLEPKGMVLRWVRLGADAECGCDGRWRYNEREAGNGWIERFKPGWHWFISTVCSLLGRALHLGGQRRRISPAFPNCDFGVVDVRSVIADCRWRHESERSPSPNRKGWVQARTLPVCEHRLRYSRECESGEVMRMAAIVRLRSRYRQAG